jgi:predicted acetyltransferase
MEMDVRTITDDEVPAWTAVRNTGFHNPHGDADAEARRPSLFLDRTWAAFDAGRIVATLRSFPTQLTVPGGGTLAASAVTAVATLGTHRRRGFASGLMAAELTRAKEGGEPVAILIASEWGIYGRFGYGAATEHENWTVDASAARLRDHPRGTVEFVDRETARKLAPEAYERHRLASPGEIGRTDFYWDLIYGILRFPSWPEPKPLFHVVARDPDGSAIGVARYEYQERYEHRVAKGVAEVGLLVAGSPAAEALLWRFLIGLDLVGSVTVEDRSVDPVLPWLLTDARHVQRGDRSDFLWLRPLDVPAMLSARSYLVPGRIVLDVVDTAGLAGGRYALDAGPDGARCEPTGAPADLTLDVSALGSIYLGGYFLGRLTTAGLVEEHSPGAVARADAMFRSPVTPWCSTWF